MGGKIGSRVRRGRRGRRVRRGRRGRGGRGKEGRWVRGRVRQQKSVLVTRLQR